MMVSKFIDQLTLAQKDVVKRKTRILFRVGITGHRQLGKETKYVTETIKNCLIQVCQVHPERIVAVSALAEGVDTIFAEVALALGIPLEVVIPFQQYADDFAHGSVRNRLKELVLQACIAHRLPYKVRSREAFLAAGQWIVRNTDLLIAVWDGQPARGKGGTADVVQYACTFGHPRILINPISHQVEEYLFKEPPDGQV